MISGTGFDFTKVGDGQITLSGANAYTGATTVRNGTLGVGANAASGSAGALGNATSNIELGDSSTTASDDISLVNTTSGITLARNIDVNNFGDAISIGGAHTSGTSTISGAIALNKEVTLTSASGGTVDITGVISGSSGVTKSGAGTVILNATNTYGGTTTISEGTLRAGVANAISDTGLVALANTSGAILELNGTNETIGRLSGGGSTGGDVTLGSATLTTGDANDTSYAGDISGTGGLTKQGSGTFSLTGGNSFSGTTTINAGTLELNNASGAALTGSTPIVVNSGAVLLLSQDDQISNTADLTFGGGTVTLAGINEGAASTAGLDTVTVSSSSNINFNGSAAVFSFDNLNITSLYFALCHLST